MTGTTGSSGTTGSPDAIGSETSVAGATGASSSDIGASGSDKDEARTFKRIGFLLPIVIFLIIGAGLGIGLTRDPSTLPSALIDKSVPSFDLPPLNAGGIGKPGLASTDLTGKVQLVNVFASWCGPCRAEHPILMKLARDGVSVQALNYKDDPEDAARFLNELGDPYERIGNDRNGRTGIEWGVYGVPETFVIDAEGKIRHKHVGPITTSAQVDELMAVIDGLER